MSAGALLDDLLSVAGVALSSTLAAALLTETDTPFGRLRHLAPTAVMSHTPPRWDRPTVPMNHDSPVWE